MPYRMLIGGELVSSADVMDVVNPATGAVFASCPRADEADLDRAVAAAKTAFPSWAARSFAERRTKLEAVATALELRTHDVARLLTQEQGKPLARAVDEVKGVVRVLRAVSAMETSDRTIRKNAKELIVEQREALGVVAAITPWNFPLMMLAMKIAPALIVGNTVVAKPAATTPLSVLLFAEIAGPLLPPGVLNIITDANDLGDALTSHPDVAKVSFTGSTATGKKVMRSAAESLKRLTLELGGNDAAIVLDDADIPIVAPKIFKAAMHNSGQVCIAAKRIYVHSSRHDELCDALARLANEAVVGDGLEQGSTMGPVQNKQQFEKIKALLAETRTEGRVIAGGQALDQDGFFIAPTIVRDLPDSARLVREEQFGPVLPVLSYDEVEDAILRANATSYGLGASVWTSNVDRGLEVAAKLEAGTVWVNQAPVLDIDVPFRGAKQSGIGVENAREGLEEYTQARIINVSL